jgi:predicted Zn-dependent protease
VVAPPVKAHDTRSGWVAHLQQLLRRGPRFRRRREQRGHHRLGLRAHVPEGLVVEVPLSRLDAALHYGVGRVARRVEGVVATEQDEEKHA